MTAVLKSIGANLEALSNKGTVAKSDYTRVGHDNVQGGRTELAKSIGSLFDSSIKADPSIGK